MGKVRPVFIKKVSKELVEKYPDVFSVDFEENKKLLQKYTVIQSKLVRNRVAGYLTHLMKNWKEKIE
ncbi:MAG: 30S ribosomal protein S17e [Candidatus Lokiarchaeota archaeon]|nr:30S ribosomal protein S17e [Candidatus Harpocratesius repetitus]